MNKFFGLPILLSFALGILLPFAALSSASFAFAVLFIMMTIAWFEVDESLFINITTHKGKLSAALFFHFLFFPLLQWFLITFFIKEESFRYGLILASLCPVAVVAPQFSRQLRASVSLSFALMILSMLFFPAVALMVIYQGSNLFLIKGIAQIHLRPIAIDMTILIIGPAVLGLAVKHFVPGIMQRFKRHAPLFNMFAIAFLAFTYMGAAVAKINLSYTPWREITTIFFLMLFQDFGIYFIARMIFKNLFNAADAEAFAISIAMKNFAISGAILLFYDPKASLASAIGFLVHAFFFNYLAFKGKRS